MVKHLLAVLCSNVDPGVLLPLENDILAFLKFYTTAVRIYLPLDVVEY